jgi:hypothetical protein
MLTLHSHCMVVMVFKGIESDVHAQQVNSLVATQISVGLFK